MENCNDNAISIFSFKICYNYSYMKNSQKCFIVPAILVSALLMAGVGVYIYKNKKEMVLKTDSMSGVVNTNSTEEEEAYFAPMADNTTKELDRPVASNHKTATIKHGDRIFSFSYPEGWYIYKNKDRGEDRVYLVKDSTNLQGSFFTQIQSAGKTHIEIGLFTDRYTAEIIKSAYRPIKIEEDKKLKNNFSETLIWFLGKDIEDWGPREHDLISTYILLLPFEHPAPRSLIASLRPFDDKNVKDIQAVEKIMSSFAESR